MAPVGRSFEHVVAAAASDIHEGMKPVRARARASCVTSMSR
jgi:hypothetical protein